MKIRLLHLYYDIMNLYGEYGNIRILEQHLKDQGFDVEVDKKTINDEIDFMTYDFIYMGSGTERNQEVILHDMINNHKEQFVQAIENEIPILLTGNSYEILGKNINSEEGLGVLNFETNKADRRINTDIIATSENLKNKVVGFVNNMSSITNNDKPLFDIEYGKGENIDSKKEGIKYKNVIGTHLIGPLLIRNPEILEIIVKEICNKKDDKFEYKEIKYVDEQKAYELVLTELENRE